VQLAAQLGEFPGDGRRVILDWCGHHDLPGRVGHRPAGAGRWRAAG